MRDPVGRKAVGRDPVDRKFFAALLLISIVAGSVRPVSAYTPDDPKVRSMVESAKGYLAANEHRLPGGKALQALVFVKDEEYDHPIVVSAVKAAEEFAAQTDAKLTSQATSYEITLIIIFLAELNADRHRATIEKLMDVMWKRQKEHGGFGYSGKADGDTSMSQYIVLAAWSAYKNGIDLDWDAIGKLNDWFLRTQDPSGAWGYQGQLASGGGRVKQTEVRLSLAAGGLGSVYVCADLMGVGQRLKNVKIERKIPAAFRPVESGDASGEEVKRSRAKGLSPTVLQEMKRALNDGNQYFADKFAVPGGKHDFYYLYAVERYKSFFAQIDGGDEVNPRWYDRGVDWLAEKQVASGGWTQAGSEGPIANTAFACLFLLRSTQKSIKASLGEGLLTGGRGLPKDTSKIRMRRGKIVSQPLSASPDEIMSIMEDPDNPDFTALADNPETVISSLDPQNRAGSLQRLRRLIQSGNAESRRLAVKALSHHRDLDNVPVLIYALADEDAEVFVAARNALRFISRKFDGFDIPQYPTAEEQQEGVLKWKTWYQSIRPGAQFLQ